MIFNSDGGGTGGKKLPILTTPGSASDLRSGKELIGADGEIITGSVTSRTSSSVTTNSNVVTIPAGIYDSQVQKTVGTAKSAATYTPGTSNQTISSGYYLTGVQTIKGDSNLVASNIKSGVSIFGVNGIVKSQEVVYETIEAAYDVNADSGNGTFIITLNNNVDELIGFNAYDINNFTSGGTRYREYFWAFGGCNPSIINEWWGVCVLRDLDARSYDDVYRIIDTVTVSGNTITINASGLHNFTYQTPSYTFDVAYIKG